jgi:hypothetical protein
MLFIIGTHRVTVRTKRASVIVCCTVDMGDMLRMGCITHYAAWKPYGIRKRGIISDLNDNRELHVDMRTQSMAHMRAANTCRTRERAFHATLRQSHSLERLGAWHS